MAKKPKDERIYLLYDGRACGGVGTDDAICVEACGEQDACFESAPHYDDCACYSFHAEGRELSDERWEWDACTFPIPADPNAKGAKGAKGRKKTQQTLTIINACRLEDHNAKRLAP